jgi:hypothetical protein
VKFGFLALRKEHRLWVPNRKIPTGTDELKKKEGLEKKLLMHNGELHDL